MRQVLAVWTRDAQRGQSHHRHGDGNGLGARHDHEGSIGMAGTDDVRRLNRRALLRGALGVAATAAGGAILGACGGSTTPTGAPAAPTAKPTTGAPTTGAATSSAAN